MGILLGFAPFLVYLIVQRLASIPVALLAAAAASLAILIHDVLIQHHSMKILGLGTFLLFGGLGSYALLTQAQWSIPGIRLSVDGGLLLVVLISIALRRPFTLQYAREQVPREFWTSPVFLRTNYAITAVWAASFAIMAAADAALLYRPDLPALWPIVATALAFVGAAYFTSWYPKRVRARAMKR